MVIGATLKKSMKDCGSCLQTCNMNINTLKSEMLE